jgi:hypothetical protein
MAVPKKARSKMLVKKNKVNSITQNLLTINKSNINIKNLKKKRVLPDKIMIY